MMNKSDKSGSARRQWTMAGVFYFGILNFLVFMAVSLWIGGDAVSGKEMNGKYFVASHGRLTEVSKSIFLYSKLHSYSLFVTHPAAMIAGVFSYILKKQDEPKPPQNV